MAQHTLFTTLPFLYPCLFQAGSATRAAVKLHNVRLVQNHQCKRFLQHSKRLRSAEISEVNAARRAAAYDPAPPPLAENEARKVRLDPTPEDYSRTPFVDKCTVTVHAGSGGNGCVAFHRDAFIPDGPPNGGDGGSGGNVWIQAVQGHTSLHKLARRGVVKAGRGIGGQGKSQGGRKGEDICIQVPVGTIVREVWRSDPVAEEEVRRRELEGMDPEEALQHGDVNLGPRSNPFIIYPGAIGNEATYVGETLPPAPKPRRSHLSSLQPLSPITLDLDKEMDKPMLLAAGAMGGLGNPHFATKGLPKPKFATKGELGVRIKLELELKLLADVGLVGLPNAGKSTLLRAISNSRTRIGDWAFTTLEPTIGTVVLDTNKGRPLIRSNNAESSGITTPRANFTVADIPGLIEDAHLDKGLGLGFLRHIERARILAFVIDLSAGNAALALQNLWKEVRAYENLRNLELNTQSESRTVEWTTFGSTSTTSSTSSNPPQAPLFDEFGQEMELFPPSTSSTPSSALEPLKLPPISAKPWFVVATKADKPETQAEFLALASYVAKVESGEEPHPGAPDVVKGKYNGWKSKIAVIPVSAIRGEGTGQIAEWTTGLLDGF